MTGHFRLPLCVGRNFVKKTDGKYNINTVLRLGRNKKYGQFCDFGGKSNIDMYLMLNVANINA
jgi:hypothetical protein